MAKAKKSSSKAKPAKKPAAGKVNTTIAVKPIKDALSKSELARHLSEIAGVEAKAAKAVLAALEATMLGAIHKKGSGQFVLHGLVKITSQAVPAKPKRFGKDPFTGQERWFPAKPATVRVKARALKKVKDAAL